jgi:hypothetical protein
VNQDWKLGPRGVAADDSVPVAEHVPTHLTFMLIERELWVAEGAPRVFGPVTPEIEAGLNEIRPGICGEARKALEARIARSALAEPA